jgi:hypothetical protein
VSPQRRKVDDQKVRCSSVGAEERRVPGGRMVTVSAAADRVQTGGAPGDTIMVHVQVRGVTGANRTCAPRMTLMCGWRILTGYRCGGKASSRLDQSSAASGLFLRSLSTIPVKPGDERLRVYW